MFSELGAQLLVYECLVESFISIQFKADFKLMVEISGLLSASFLFLDWIVFYFCFANNLSNKRVSEFATWPFLGQFLLVLLKILSYYWCWILHGTIQEYHCELTCWPISISIYFSSMLPINKRVNQNDFFHRYEKESRANPVYAKDSFIRLVQAANYI